MHFWKGAAKLGSYPNIDNFITYEAGDVNKNIIIYKKIRTRQISVIQRVLNILK